MKNLRIIIKKIVFSFLILYGYNLISVNFNMIVPINIYSLGFMFLFGTPGLIALVLLKTIIM